MNAPADIRAATGLDRARCQFDFIQDNRRLVVGCECFGLRTTVRARKSRQNVVDNVSVHVS